MNKLNIAIIFGGRSNEYDVSLRSASSVIRNIPRDKYNIILIGITKDGGWYEYSGDVELIENDGWIRSGAITPAFIPPDASVRGIVRLSDGAYDIVKLDAAFPVLHGKNGEDGTIQGLLKLAGIPCVGCGIAASCNCMDKEITHIILKDAGVNMAKWLPIRKDMLRDLPALKNRIAGKLGYPVFIKPANSGSSVGVSKVKTPDELAPALELAFAHDAKVLAEAVMTGREVECAVLGNDEPVASVVGELVPDKEFYDYEAKYISGGTKLHMPARISESAAEIVRDAALKAYRAMGCKGMARVDFFADGDKVSLIEINTIPGFTSVSMYPRLLELSGIAYPELLDRLVRLAIQDSGD